MVYHVSMPVTELVPVEEYLSTDYSPDCDFADGVLEDRNVVEKDHSKLQMALAAWFYARRKELGIQVFPEQRIRVSTSRYRVLDLCVTIGEPDEQIFTTPPFSLHRDPVARGPHDQSAGQSCRLPATGSALRLGDRS